MKATLAVLTAALLGVSSVAIAQTKLAAPVQSCAGEIKKEAAGFDAAVKKGKAEGKIDPKEEADLAKTHADVMKTIGDAEKDGKLTADECKNIHGKLVAEHKQLAAALGLRAGNTCKNDVTKSAAAFDAAMKKGKAEGKIDAKEEAELMKTHASVTKAIEDGKKDGKFTAAECKSIHEKVVAEHKQLMAALSTRADSACRQQIAAGNKALAEAYNKGVAAKKIDAKEQADLKKSHADLLEMEKKAAADGNFSADECKSILAKIADEKTKIAAAAAK